MRGNMQSLRLPHDNLVILEWWHVGPIRLWIAGALLTGSSRAQREPSPVMTKQTRSEPTMGLSQATKDNRRTTNVPGFCNTMGVDSLHHYGRSEEDCNW